MPYYPPGSSVAITQTTVELSSAQLLANYVTPVEIVPAPGGGKMLVVLQSVYSLSFGTVAYTVSGGGALYYATPNPGTSADGGDQQLLPATFNAYTLTSSIGASTGAGSSTATVENAALVYGNFNGPNTLGDGTLKITVFTVTVDVP